MYKPQDGAFLPGSDSGRPGIPDQGTYVPVLD
jgi:hypothetical protein